ncbi:MAG: hypothetical protein HYV65_02470 [Candidatus Spechtbacteria bacterium]|nr:hypothetical protein [Candidatus Spechtbacteria bacterium]
MATIEKIELLENALSRFRQAPMEESGEEKILAYRDAEMRLADFMPNELNLTSLYLLEDHIESLKRLRAEFLDRYQIDILRLSSVLHIKTDDGLLVGMAPPFVEIYEETVRIVSRPGDRRPPATVLLQIPVLIDGIHRAWIAREEGLSLRCIVVSGALKAYPPYAYPNDWSQVRVYSTKPETKKFYRREDAHSYMAPLTVLRQTGDAPPPREWGR